MRDIEKIFNHSRPIRPERIRPRNHFSKSIVIPGREGRNLAARSSQANPDQSIFLSNLKNIRTRLQRRRQRRLCRNANTLSRSVILPIMIRTNHAVILYLSQRKPRAAMNAQVFPGMDPIRPRHKTISRSSTRRAFNSPCRTLEDHPTASHSSIKTGSFIIGFKKEFQDTGTPPDPQLREERVNEAPHFSRTLPESGDWTTDQISVTPHAPQSRAVLRVPSCPSWFKLLTFLSPSRVDLPHSSA